MTHHLPVDTETQVKLKQVRSMTAISLDGRSEVTKELISEQISQVADLVQLDTTAYAEELDQLERELEAEFNVYVGNSSALSDDSDHVAWLGDASVSIRWDFWERYKLYLQYESGLPEKAIRSIDETTTDILARLENPSRPGKWDRRGLVVGQVQSGKTANYTGLVAKALDSGYKLVVILAGIHNSLRSQTQVRIDHGILGFDTRDTLRSDVVQNGGPIGAGKLGKRFLPVNSFTSSKEKGDFNRKVADNIGVIVGGNDPTVLVIKKNAHILNNLYSWATELRKEEDPETKRRIVKNVPILVIDDEADHASVDTSAPKRGQDEQDVDPTKINGLIRKFLDTFEKSAYVAYTATPFANIFISPDKDHADSGIDLFPRSFIVNLPAPSTYIGPTRVFGMNSSVGSVAESVEPLPITRPIDDYELWVPDGHKVDHRITEPIPPSLSEAILSFLIGGALRSLRGQGNKHHSMLVHVTRFIKVQSQVADQITESLESTKNRLLYGEGHNPELKSKILDLYRSDFKPTHSQLLNTSDISALVGEIFPEEDLLRAIVDVADKTKVYEMHGDSDDALNYDRAKDGLSVIAVGGNKLSRGLTLEGLSVSYYLRASKMYDTLMQMGRWFGYRNGYLDVCRLYTTRELISWYGAITYATEELQAEFDAMAATGRTPIDFGLKVRHHPDGLLVTSPSKLRHAKKIDVSFAGTITETTSLLDNSRDQNWLQLEQMIERMGPKTDEASGLRIWRGVGYEDVLDFLAGYSGDPAAIHSQPSILVDYIRSRNTENELINWTVAVAHVSKNDAFTATAAGMPFGPTIRATLTRTSFQGTTRYTFRRIGSPSHEVIDLNRDSDSAKWNRLLAETIRDWEASSRKNKSEKPPTRPSGLRERGARSPRDGLIIIYPIQVRKVQSDENKPEIEPGDVGRVPLLGYAISFPSSPNAKPVAYQVNSIYRMLEFGDEADWSEA